MRLFSPMSAPLPVLNLEGLEIGSDTSDAAYKYSPYTPAGHSRCDES